MRYVKDLLGGMMWGLLIVVALSVLIVVFAGCMSAASAAEPAVAEAPCGSDGWPDCDTVEHDHLNDWGEQWSAKNVGLVPYGPYWAGVCYGLSAADPSFSLPSGWCPTT